MVHFNLLADNPMVRTNVRMLRVRFEKFFTAFLTCFRSVVLHCDVRLQRPKPASDLSAGNSSEDVMANDLSDNDAVEDDDDVGGNIE